MKNLLTIIIAIAFGGTTVMAQSNSNSPKIEAAKVTSVPVQKTSPVATKTTTTATTEKKVEHKKPESKHVAITRSGRQINTMSNRIETKAKTKNDKRTPNLNLTGTKQTSGNNKVAEKKTETAPKTVKTTEKAPDLEKRAEERGHVGANNQEHNATKPEVKTVQPKVEKAQVATKENKPRDLKKRAAERTAKKNEGSTKPSGPASYTTSKGK